MFSNRAHIYLITILCFFMNQLKAESLTHLVRSGEYLSGILATYGYFPIYGKYGYLQELIENNPYLKNRIKLVIFPLDEIKMPTKINGPFHETTQDDQYHESKNITENFPISEIHKLQFIPNAFFSAYLKTSWKKISTDQDNHHKNSYLILSEPGFGVGWKYDQLVLHDTSLTFDINIERAIFKGSDKISLVSNSANLLSFSFFSVFKDTYLFRLQHSDKLYLSNPAENLLKLNKLKISSLGAGINFSLYDFNNYQLKNLVVISNYFLTSKSIENFNSGFGLDILFNLKFKKKNIGFGYELTSLKFESLNISTHDIYWLLAMEF